jgi:alpha-tubulin suppressor-like RCC1 family protein
MARRLSPRGARTALACATLVVLTAGALAPGGLAPGALAPGALTTSASFTASASAPGGAATAAELAPLTGVAAVVGDDGRAVVSWDEPAPRPDADAHYTVERVVGGVPSVLTPVSAPISALPDATPEGLVSKTVTRISMSQRIGCLIAEGALYCWGATVEPSTPASTGTGDTDAQLSPVRVGGLLADKTVTDVSVGVSAVCAVADADAYCWGAGELLGQGSAGPRSYVPMLVGGALAHARVTRVAVGDGSVCAIADDLAYCWGFGGGGRLGNGGTSSHYSPTLVRGVLAGRVVTDITVGPSHACAVSDGRAYCWGGNTAGTLGDGTTTDRSLPTPVDTSGVLTGVVTQLSAGWQHSCAVADARAYCWGANAAGQLGDGTTTDSTVPVAVAETGPLAGADATQIVAGAVHSCAIADGAVGCWGSNLGGRLGTGTTTSSNTPVAVNDALLDAPATVVTAGQSSSCAVASGVAFCWGAGSGRLGSGTTASSTVPVAVRADPAFVRAECGAGWRPLENPLRCGAPLVGGEATGFIDDVTTAGLPRTASAVSVESSACAIAEGIPVCWGGGSSGALGTGSLGDQPVPVAVDRSGVLAGTVATDIAVGANHTCLAASGKAYCWGNNFYGTLGDGTTTSRLSPVAVVDTGVLAGATVTRVAVSNSHSCAITSAGRLACWGQGGNGELGNGATVNRSVPVAVGGLLAGKVVTDVVPGGSSTCALADGSVYCWGYWSKLGSDTATASSSVPVLVAGALAGKTVTALSGDYSAVCALAAGLPYCWGDGGYGLYGDGTWSHRGPWPVAMTGALSGQTVDEVFVGRYTSCALAGQLVCWGASIGPVPVAVDGGVLAGATVTDVGIGDYATCAIADGAIACWGGIASMPVLGRSDVLVSAIPLEVDGSLGLAGDTCASGWTPIGGTRCAPGAGIDIGYRVSYAKRGWATDAIDAVVTRAGTP